MSPARISAVCPSCGRKLAKIETMNHATQFVRRTCPGCGERWQLKVVPLGSVLNGHGRADSIEFTFLGRRS